MSSDARIHATLVTSRGMRKQTNEDSAYCDAELGLFVICDGMGGHGGGDIASQIAVRQFVSHYSDHKDMASAIVYANAQVVRAAQSGIGASRMGSTIVAAQMSQNGSRQVNFAWVGDSRAYLVSTKTIQLLTEDHAYAYKLMKEGLISPEEMRRHPYRSVLLQSLGGGDMEVHPSLSRVKMPENTVLLLCSDGLNAELEDSEILELMQQHSSLGAAANAMLKLCLQRGAQDNVTIILACYANQS